MVKEGFLKAKHRQMVLMNDNPVALLEDMQR
jgi:hypothetical protein